MISGLGSGEGDPKKKSVGISNGFAGGTPGGYLEGRCWKWAVIS